MRRALAITLALFALLNVVVQLRYAPPSPAPLDAPRARFSATRAREVQARLVGDGATRFIGTPGNARGRAVISAELARLGWAVETQTAWSCTHHGMCGLVTNVIGRLPGREPALPGVLLTAHHDSVPASAGASDDGLGTAALLELARGVVEGPRPRRSVIVALTDGEEAGLLGAGAFVREHPLARSVAWTINVDSRGSHGPSQLFETSSGNASLVALAAEHLTRPVTTSLFYEVYRRMPNDTDFSLTKTIAAGVNFANVAGIEDYHTTRDRLDTSDPGTLQQHGDNALAMTRAFAEARVGEESLRTRGARAAEPGDAVWFDVLALGVVWWPARWSTLLAIVGLALVAGHAARARAFDRGAVVFLPSLAAGVVAAFAAGWLLRAAGALPAPFVARPEAALAALSLGGGAATLGVMLMFARGASSRALWSGTWLGWGALGVVAASVAPGASYLFVVPTLVAAIAGWLPMGLAAAAPATAAAALVLALAGGLYDALGFAVAGLAAVPTALLATTLAPMLVDAPPLLRRAPLALAAMALACVLVGALLPKFTPAFPQRANVVFRQDEGGARAFVDTTWGPSTWGEPPAAMLAAIGEPRASAPALPWTLASIGAAAPRVDVKAPSAEVLSAKDDGQRRRVRLRVRSSRGAQTIALVFPQGRRVEVKVEGRYAPARAVTGGALVGLLAVPEEGALVELDAEAGPLPITLLDRTFGVPPGTSAEAAVRARPANATPSQDGDQTVVTTALTL
jgi:hypothetical protein